MSIPVVAIVGRPNVGKSTIFNRIVGDRISIVENIPGVTRDRIYAHGEWLATEFSIIDTGGIDIGEEPFLKQITDQAEIAIEEADVIVFVVSAKEGLSDADERVAKILYQSDKPVILAVNKADNPEQRQDIYDFYALGFGKPYPISGIHGLGLGDLLDVVVQSIPHKDKKTEDNSIRVSLIGRPNVGKSSLVNALLGEDRAIVSDISGTTRDAVDTKFSDKTGTEFTIVDTAGIRKRGKIYENVEKYSVMRAMKAIDNSNVVLVLLNAEEGILEQDKRIAGYAHNSGRGIIIVVNKWDKLNKNNHSIHDFELYIKEEFQYLAYAPIIFVSAVTHQRVGDIYDLIKKVSKNHSKRIQSATLNNVIMDAVAMHSTPNENGKRMRIFYTTQVAVQPPTFVVFVNEPELMHFSYKRYLVNKIREYFDFTGTSIHLIERRRK